MAAVRSRGPFARHLGRERVLVLMGRGRGGVSGAKGMGMEGGEGGPGL